YRADLIKDLAELKPKFRAARRYAKEKGWTFKIYTEREIRTPYLTNVQFLWRYRDTNCDPGHYRRLKLTLQEMEEAEVDTLLLAAYSSQAMRDEALWTLWSMVRARHIQCDLSVPLTMTTPVWLPG
ncbi:MAG: TnsA endonuclease C-terminal domain-containing protein, partial [Rhodocyclaceae bacterium]|nr:TnsA endonuclease C-terminal domain-containing protein [Rhodocyclaceae bacterium]